MVLFVDRIYAKALHFLAEPVHLDAAWAEPSAIDGTLIQEIVHSKWTGEVAVLYRSVDSVVGYFDLSRSFRPLFGFQ